MSKMTLSSSESLNMETKNTDKMNIKIDSFVDKQSNQSMVYLRRTFVNMLSE